MAGNAGNVNLQFNGNPMPGIPWAEFIGPDGMQSNEGNFGYEQGNQITMMYLVDWNDQEEAVKELLGVNETISNPFGGAGFSLSRVPPGQHPYYYWLYATRVAIKPLRWESKTPGTGPNAQTSSQYKLALLTVLFQQLKYRVMTDAVLDVKFPPVGSVRQEQYRFVEFVPQIGVEVISREGGGNTPPFKWAEGPLTPLTFTSPVPQALHKADLVLKWCRVPLYGGVLASSANYLASPNLDSLVGTVSSAAFFGRPAQTLKFSGYRIVLQEAPVSPQAMGFALSSDFPSLVCDVELDFQYWNPPTFGATTGHNLAPIPQDATGRWAAIVAEGVPLGGLPSTANASIYQVADWKNMFVPNG